jgi:hypothetical protein
MRLGAHFSEPERFSAVRIHSRSTTSRESCVRRVREAGFRSHPAGGRQRVVGTRRRRYLSTGDGLYGDGYGGDPEGNGQKPRHAARQSPSN